MTKSQLTKEEWLTTCLGLGRLPWAPGTWGSLPPVVLYMVLGFLYPAANPLVQGLFFFGGVWICVRYVPRMIEKTGLKDPQEVVADEVAGQAIVMVVLGLLAPLNVCTTAALGFALFRLCDITKPWPCRRLETLPAGWGVLADDLMAGVYATVLAISIIRLLPAIFA